MKIILCGYNWAGCKALQLLLDLKHELFVYTHEGPWHVPSLIDYCKEKDVAFSTENISDSELPFKPDVICSIYYRYIIKENIIDSCNHRIFNLHPALLPKYRGCSSLTWALINGESKVGFTFHYIDPNIDTGKIILQKELDVEPFDNQGTLYNRVMFKSMEYFIEVLDLVMGGCVGIDQIGEGSYYKRGCPYDGLINAEWDSLYIKRFIRAMIYPPYSPAKFQQNNVLTFSDYLNLKRKIEKE